MQELDSQRGEEAYFRGNMVLVLFTDVAIYKLV